MNREIVLWEVFLPELEKLFNRVKIPAHLSGRILKGESDAPYIELINHVHTFTGLNTNQINDEKFDSRLISIFSKVKSQEPSKPYFLPILPLSQSTEMFPISRQQDEDRTKAADEFKSLLSLFFKELNDYLENHETPDFETFYYLAQKYLWCIPAFSSTVNDGNSELRNEKDSKRFSGGLHPVQVKGAEQLSFKKAPLAYESGVSLFQHLKSTAAAVAVYIDLLEKGEEKREKPFALVGFDIFGIQDFIYTIASKGASKSLKGRSFYIQKLEMAVSRYLLDTFGLPVTNVVYSGGGKGFILVPAHVLDRIPMIEKEINSELFGRMGAKISIGIAGTCFAPHEFNRFNTILNAVNVGLSKSKKQRFASILNEKYDDLFNPEKIDLGIMETCSICGKEGKPEEVIDDIRWCGQCLEFKETGADLNKAIAISEKRWKKDDVELKFKEVLDSIGFISRDAFTSEFQNEDRFFYFLNNTHDFSQYIRKGNRAGFMFIAGNKAPMKDKEEGQVEFNDMAEASKGAKKLGVVRGDVDGLGNIFATGLGESVSLERLAQLSFLMKHFFCSMINLYFTVERKEFIVYSGGDDFFIVGPWNDLVDDLVSFRHAFEKYTGFNPAFSFSASFNVFQSHFPAFKFAEVAGNMEHKAKENENMKWNIKKNSICFMGKPVFWDDFYRLQEIEEYLVRLVEDEDIPRSYIQLIQRIGQYNTESMRKGKTEAEITQSARFHRWKWYYAWQAARLLERKKNKDPVQKLLKVMDAFLFKSTYNEKGFMNTDSLYLIEISARWAEMKTKI